MAETSYSKGYGDQLPREVSGVDPDASPPERMRQALARMVALGLGKNYTDENLWAAQGQAQLPAPQVNPGMPQVTPPPGLTFPTAPAAPQLDREFQPKENPKSDSQRLAEDEVARPFGGKGEVAGPYELPKKAKKGKN